jgi:hypothetical protein
MPTEEEKKERDIRAVRGALFQYREEPVMPEMVPLDQVRQVQWWGLSNLCDLFNLFLR